MSKMGLRTLKKQLKDYKRAELIELIAKMYKENQASQDYLEQLFSNENQVEVVKIYQEKIYKSFFSSSARFNIDKAKDYLEEGLELCQNEKEYSNLLLSYVESGIELLVAEGIYFENILNDLIAAFKLFKEYYFKYSLEKEYQERVEKILMELTHNEANHHFKEAMYQICLDILRK